MTETGVSDERNFPKEEKEIQTINYSKPSVIPVRPLLILFLAPHYIRRSDFFLGMID